MAYGKPACAAGGGCLFIYVVRTGTDRDLVASVDGLKVTARCWGRRHDAVVLRCPGSAVGYLWTGDVQVEVLAGPTDIRPMLAAIRPMSVKAKRRGLTAPKPFSCAAVRAAGLPARGLPKALVPAGGC